MKMRHVCALAKLVSSVSFPGSDDRRGDESGLVSIPLPPRSQPLFKIIHEAVSKAIRDDGIRGIGTTPKKSYDSYLRRHQTIRRCSAQ